MKLTLNLVGGLLVVCGTTSFLQGINVLPGSFMTGQIRWAGSRSQRESHYCGSTGAGSTEGARPVLPE